jgi:diacylglycerol kinase (ATP)
MLFQTMQKVLLFVNPFLEQRRRQRATIERVMALLRSKNLQVDLQQTFSARSAGDQAREAIAAGYDTIIVCGGDGTIFDVVQGVAGSDIPLGVIPLGTGNVLAQNMHLPRNPIAAAQALLRSTPRSVPLGKLTCHRPGHRKPGSWLFACVAGLGTHAYLMNAAERWGKHFSGRASYYFAGVDLLLRQSIEPFEIEFTTTNGEVIKRNVCEALTLRVAELNRWRPGGSLDKAVIRLAICDATTRLGLAEASFHALARTSPSTNGRPRVHYFDTVRVACRLIPDYEYRNSILVEADGEVLGASEAVMTMANEKLTLLWPD